MNDKKPEPNMPQWLHLLRQNKALRLNIAVGAYIIAMLVPLLSAPIGPDEQGVYNMKLIGGVVGIGALFPLMLFGLSQIVPSWRQPQIRIWVFILVCLISIYSGLMRYVF